MSPSANYVAELFVMYADTNADSPMRIRLGVKHILNQHSREYTLGNTSIGSTRGGQAVDDGAGESGGLEHAIVSV